MSSPKQAWSKSNTCSEPSDPDKSLKQTATEQKEVPEDITGDIESNQQNTNEAEKQQLRTGSKESSKLVEQYAEKIKFLEEELEKYKRDLKKETVLKEKLQVDIENLTEEKKSIEDKCGEKFASEIHLREKLELEENKTKKLKNEKVGLEKQLREEREKCTKRTNELSHLRESKKNVDSECLRLSDNVKQLTKDNNQLKEQLSIVKSRLSKEIGDKVSNANPDLADLSDSKRPTKIGERYQELYDNQWTDAFETAVKRFAANGEANPERSAIDLLLTILKDCYKVCDEEYERQAKLLMKLLATDKRDLDVSSDLKKRFKAARRINAKRDSADVCEKYLASLNADKPDEGIILDVKAFVNECVDVCWMMVIQDPQVVLHKEAVLFDKFNSNLYKAYTVSGKKVDFVVWPALLLHTEGAPLAKGIAQCVKEAEDSSHVRCVNERNKGRAPSPCEEPSSNDPNAKGGNKGRLPSPSSDVRSAKEGNNGRAPSPQEGTHKAFKNDLNKKGGTEVKLEGKNGAESATNAKASISSERGKNDNTGKMFANTNDTKDRKKQKQENETSQVDKDEKEKSPDHLKVSAEQRSKKQE